MNDEEFEQWQEQRNAAMYAALMELLVGIERQPGLDLGTRALALNCRLLLEEFDN